MKFIILIFTFIPVLAFAQKQIPWNKLDSVYLAIDKEVKRVDDLNFHEKLRVDTLVNITEDYELHYVVALYEGNSLVKVRIDQSDGMAGDISSGSEFYFKKNELMLINRGSSYFMAGGCGITEYLYFVNGDFFKLITDNGCRGEDAEQLKQYIGDYAFNIESALAEYGQTMAIFKVRYAFIRQMAFSYL
ncbi:MAG TPA: hypothetical protein VK177_08915 [Flavobacteriales bacterium]|nr:hypothetical protein [Flavobacteriales bacterium]